MEQKQIDNFFKVLNQSIREAAKEKITIILTGAAAGILMGSSRPSADIDFCISYNKRYDMESAIKRATEITGIAVNFSEDIDRWSQITFLDYKHHTLPYKTFGKVEVVLLAPLYWSIGKVTRYLNTDIDDLIKVLKNNFISAGDLVKVWARALVKSPRSAASFTFKAQVEDFFKTYGSSVWGKGFQAQVYIGIFREACDAKK